MKQTGVNTWMNKLLKGVLILMAGISPVVSPSYAQTGPNGIGWNPGPSRFMPQPSPWGKPWGSPWYGQESVSVPHTVSNGYNLNRGLTKVIACGYDAEGVWRVLPMLVSYDWNGVQYDVNVINAWNPWTRSWDKGVNSQAFNTAYYLNNIQYDFYTVLSFGTFYFNL